MEEKKKIIEVKGICKTYDNEGVLTQAVCGVSFDIREGEFVSIMGPSGSGKSTLMQILGFLDRATGGEYIFDGRVANDFSDDELAEIRNRKIGFIFQTFNLLPRTKVFENVELPLVYDKNGSARANEEKVMKALENVGMTHRKDYYSNQLSGGERQRVAIARALVNDPSVIFADEPTGNLDSKSGTQIMRILQELNRAGKTIILVTHETFTAEHGTRIIRMKDGTIVSDDPILTRRFAQDGELLK
ncbi:MAG: ABC transporter ATP-binding protein [Patescibacteria group bacterium]